MYRPAHNGVPTNPVQESVGLLNNLKYLLVFPFFSQISNLFTLFSNQVIRCK